MGEFKRKKKIDKASACLIREEDSEIAPSFCAQGNWQAAFSVLILWGRAATIEGGRCAMHLQPGLKAKAKRAVQSG